VTSFLRYEVQSSEGNKWTDLGEFSIVSYHSWLDLNATRNIDFGDDLFGSVDIEAELRVMRQSLLSMTTLALPRMCFGLVLILQ